MPVTVFCVESTPPKLHAEEALIPLTLNPVSQVTIEYFNEGGANVLFRLTPLPGQDLPSTLEHRLLRIRKALPHVPRAEDQLTFLSTHFLPLFPTDNLLSHTLIHLSPDVPALLNAHLTSLVRPGHRSADFLSLEETSALLVTDMSPLTPGDALLQLKPKWLTQSPNAPPNARRCRTCAIRAQRQSERGGRSPGHSISSLGRTPSSSALRAAGGAAQAQDLCPLDLVHSDLDARRGAVYALTTDRRLREFLLSRAQPLLQTLRARQLEFDSVGILGTQSIEQIQGLCRAMTLRDCTLYLRKALRDEGGEGGGGGAFEVEARLGDLDLKQPEKLMRWKALERKLIEEGWYTNSEFEDRWTKETRCVLSRCD